MILMIVFIKMVAGANSPIDASTDTTVTFQIVQPKPLRLVLVMDISGSMEVSLTWYFYSCMYICLPFVHHLFLFLPSAHISNRSMLVCTHS